MARRRGEYSFGALFEPSRPAHVYSLLRSIDSEVFMPARSAAVLLIAAALSCGSAVLTAGQDGTRPDAPLVQKSNEILSLDEIVQRVKMQQPGKVVEAELDHKRGRYIYEIDVIGDDGVKKELKYDAKTGALLSSKAEDADEDD
jgi:hypothetical protein